MQDRAKYLRGYEIHRVIDVGGGAIVVVYVRQSPPPPAVEAIETTGEVIDLASRRAA